MTGEEIRSTLKNNIICSPGASNAAFKSRYPIEKGRGYLFLGLPTATAIRICRPSWSTMNLGFGNKAIGDAIKEQVDRYCFIGPSYGAESRADAC